MKTPTIEQIENELDNYYDLEARQNKFAAKAIHAIIPDNSELIDFIQNDVLDALNSLQCYIANSCWTRKQQAEYEACELLIEKAKKLCAKS